MRYSWRLGTHNLRFQAPKHLHRHSKRVVLAFALTLFFLYSLGSTGSLIGKPFNSNSINASSSWLGRVQWFTEQDRKCCDLSGVSCPFSTCYPNPQVSIIPKIWQTNNYAGVGSEWPEENPGYRYELLLDGAADHYVSMITELYIPSLSRIWQQIKTPILRFDLLRYLILYAEGGYYTDIDTSPRRPIREWIPTDFDKSTINVIVGVEADEPTMSDEEMQGIDFTGNFQLCQWTMGANAKHPFFKILISSILDILITHADDAAWPDRLQILQTTGPGGFTKAMLTYLKEQDPHFSLSDYRLLERPKQVKDVLILPQYAFAHFGTYSSRNKTDEQEELALVHHASRGTWKALLEEPPSQDEDTSAGTSDGVTGLDMEMNAGSEIQMQTEKDRPRLVMTLTPDHGQHTGTVNGTSEEAPAG